MKLLSSMLRSVNRYSHQTRLHWSVRTFFTGNDSSGGNIDNKGNKSSESADDFERRIFSSFLDNNSNTSSFFQKLDRYEKGRGKSGFGSQVNNDENAQFGDGLGDGFDTLSDGMDNKLKKSARTFVYSDEIQNDDYAFRPDVMFKPGTTYTVKDLDLTKPGIQKSFRRPEFDVTTEEVLKKADFRNVRFLANFITEAGIIIKRSKTRISAKAQRKVAREIKTARAFGLMPFTTMGTKPFVFGKTMQDMDEDYEYYNYNPPMRSAASEIKDLI